MDRKPERDPGFIKEGIALPAFNSALHILCEVTGVFGDTWFSNEILRES